MCGMSRRFGRILDDEYLKVSRGTGTLIERILTQDVL